MLDLLTALKIVINFVDKTIKWDKNNKFAMTMCGTIHDTQIVELLYLSTQHLPTIQQAEECHNKILDADYSKMDTKEYVKSLNYLAADKKTIAWHDTGQVS